MRNQSLVSLAVVSTLVFATACAAQSTGSGTGTDPTTGASITPPKKSLDEADASTADTATCGGFQFSNTACGTCGAKSCCASAAACQGDSECRALIACVQACSDSTCIDTCSSDHASGLSKYEAFGTCAENNCSSECSSNSGGAPPAKKGIGDPCTSNADCHDGTCNATSGTGWCTTSCTLNTDCSGYPQLNNQEGQFNFCIQTQSNTNTCFPGCSTTSDCATYGPGLTCQNVGTGVNVCSR